MLDNMAPPWVPKCMFIKCTQTILKLPCFISQTRQACCPNDANFPFNLQMKSPSYQQAIPITREIGSNCGRLKTCEMHSPCTSVRGSPGFRGKPFGYKCVADAYEIPRETFCRRGKGPLTGLFRHLAGGRPHS